LVREVVIVGVAEEALTGGRMARSGSVLQIQARAALAALAESKLSLRDVDGLLTAGTWGLPGAGTMAGISLAEFLGIHPRYSDSTNIGGAAFEAHVGHAAMAIERGYCEVALITYGSLAKTTKWSGSTVADLGLQYENIWGLPRPVGHYALAASRYAHLYGLKAEHLGQVALAARRWAQKNPAATRREPLEMPEYLASPMLCDPLRALDCCLVTDGAGAIVLTTAEHARALGVKSVFVRGFGEAHTHAGIGSMPELARLDAAISSGQRAFEMAGVKPACVDIAQIYDSFTITVLLSLEALGFCGPGEAKDFVANQRTAPGGTFPMNTTGGGLSYCHPGMFGIFLLIEAVRQLRGDSGERQVQNARTALVHGTGGILSSGATCLLTSN